MIVGLCSLVLGVLGIVLPLLPTVPFVLLSAYCFARSSTRMHDWLMSHPWFSEPLNNWQQQKAMRRSLKHRAMLLSGISFTISILLVPLVWVKLLLCCGLVILLLFLWRIPEIADNDVQSGVGRDVKSNRKRNMNQANESESGE